MDPKRLSVVLVLLCFAYMVSSAPSSRIDDSDVGFGISSGTFDGGYDDLPGYPGYGYDVGNPYRRRYRYPHFYPPIAVLAG